MDKSPTKPLLFPLNLLEQVEHTFEVLPVPPSYPGKSPLPIPNPTKSFWTHSAPNVNPLAKEGSTSKLPMSADVCIIGSGITGVSAAYHLANLAREEQAGVTLNAVILEARDFCSGATGRNGGHLTPSSFHGFHGLSTAFGKAEAAKALKLEHRCASSIVSIVEEHKWEDEVDLVHGGNIRLHFTEKEWEENRRDWTAAHEAGLDFPGVEWLSEEETLKEYGTAHSSTRIKEGHNIYPLKLVTKLFYLAKRSASSASSWNPFSWLWLSKPSDPFTLDLYTHTPVLSISPSATADRWTVTTSRGTIDCRCILHATNAYVSHLLPQLAGPDGVVPTRGQVMSTRASTEKLWTIAWSGNDGFEYWFPRAVKPSDSDKRPLIILGGGRDTAVPTFEFYNADDGTINPLVSKTLRSFLPSVFPTQFEEGTEPEMEWTGVMGFTRTNEPMVGSVLDEEGKVLPGQFMSVGYSGHGMTRAFSCAEIVAQMVFARLLDRPWSEPEWVPAHYLTRAVKAN